MVFHNKLALSKQLGGLPFACFFNTGSWRRLRNLNYKVLCRLDCAPNVLRHATAKTFQQRVQTRTDLCFLNGAIERAFWQNFHKKASPVASQIFCCFFLYNNVWQRDEMRFAPPKRGSNLPFLQTFQPSLQLLKEHSGFECFQHDGCTAGVGCKWNFLHVTKAKQCRNVRFVRLRREWVTKKNYQIQIAVGKHCANLLVATKWATFHALNGQCRFAHDERACCARCIQFVVRKCFFVVFCKLDDFVLLFVVCNQCNFHFAPPCALDTLPFATLGQTPFCALYHIARQKSTVATLFCGWLGQGNATCNAVQRQLSFTKKLAQETFFACENFANAPRKATKESCQLFAKLRFATGSEFNFFSLICNKTKIAPLPTNFANSRLRACVFNKHAPPFALQIATVVYGCFCLRHKVFKCTQEAQFRTTGVGFRKKTLHKNASLTQDCCRTPISKFSFFFDRKLLVDATKR